MNKNIFKSIGAVLAGFMVGAILSIGMDTILEQNGVMKQTAFKEASIAVILLVIGYRIVFNIIGCYVAASLAPSKPMRHALIIGYIGFVLSIVGWVVMIDQAVFGYNLAIVLISIPCAYAGVWLKERQLENQK